MIANEPSANPTEKSMQTDPTEDRKPQRLTLLVMAGVPKHGTRWARAKHPIPERA
ncbi:MAG: hypothetical protein OEY22_10040 [Candidatus Bathyarchaeota archaeon]|nr:hypothetical protein [Candidatus Bathyarchaeota archaeon]MDH5788725.1 hypothetical protein [Candidatus Bathyarchaeota archaeon]